MALFSSPEFSCRKWTLFNVVRMLLPKHVPGEADDEPVEDLKEGDEAEAEAEAKETAHA